MNAFVFGKVSYFCWDPKPLGFVCTAASITTIVAWYGSHACSFAISGSYAVTEDAGNTMYDMFLMPCRAHAQLLLD